MNSPMKLLSSSLLVASLALNAAAVILLVVDRAGTSGAAAPVAALEAARPAHPPATGAIEGRTWASLPLDDLPALVDRLREAGFPREMVRAIVGALVDEQFAPRRRALDPHNGRRPYWKDESVDAGFYVGYFRLRNEQQKVLRDLLGADALADDPLTLARQRARFGDLPPGKLAAAQIVFDEHEQKRIEVYYLHGGITLEEMNRIDRELRTALAGVLSPAELAEYELRSSQSARMLRSSLAAFNPTEEEFRAIFKLRQPFDEEHLLSTTVPTEGQVQRRSEAMKLLETQIKLQLSPERAALYVRTSDSDYRRTAQLVARLELPAETVENLWQIRKEFTGRRDEIGASSGAPEERAARLATLQREAIARVTPLLGNAGRVESYRDYGGGWITQLTGRPVTGR